MEALLIIIFVVGYAAIAFEHQLRLNKAASALITGVLCWLIYFLQTTSLETAHSQLMHHVGDIASILFFLLGAMTIVEVIDSYKGFDIITGKIKATRKSVLLVIITLITFFLSALLDNLTTAIVMTSLCNKLLTDKEDRLWFAGMVVIAANAGGAWSPLGDVTTTMLWIGGQVTALNIMVKTFIPSLVVCAVPLLILGYRFKGKQTEPRRITTIENYRQGSIILFSGIGLLLFVPAFKTITHLPPFMGMMLALGFMWVITSILHYRKRHESNRKFTVAEALEKIDTTSILFFLGILLAVSALESFGTLKVLADALQNTLHNDYLIGASLGLLSAIVDNVPLVAAAQGMYSLTDFPTDHRFWEFLALTTGTGGSVIIIGSAAGVAAMGISHIRFMWYIKNISWLALLGFISGCLVFVAQQALVG